MWSNGAALLLVLLCPSSVAADNTIDCITNTGGTCATAECFAWRGPTRCDGGRCFCTSGTCAGADGVCTDIPYQRPGNGTEVVQYRIKNARWQEYFIDADGTGSLDVQKNADGDDRRFNVLMPGFAGGEEALNAPVFIIQSVRWPESALMATRTGNKGAQYVLGIFRVDGELGGWGNDPSVLDFAMRLTRAPVKDADGEYPIMLSPFRYPDQYARATSLSWDVSLGKDDPGAGGYWYFEPRLPQELRDKLPPFSGVRCTFACGEISGVGDASAAVLGTERGSCGFLLSAMTLVLATVSSLQIAS